MLPSLPYPAFPRPPSNYSVWCVSGDSYASFTGHDHNIPQSTSVIHVGRLFLWTVILTKKRATAFKTENGHKRRAHSQKAKRCYRFPGDRHPDQKWIRVLQQVASKFELGILLVIHCGPNNWIHSSCLGGGGVPPFLSSFSPSALASGIT